MRRTVLLAATLLFCADIALAQASYNLGRTGASGTFKWGRQDSLGPPSYSGSTTSQLQQNKVAGCNSGVPVGLCGTAASAYSISGGVATITVTNTFNPGEIVGISGATTATSLNGLILTTNGSTDSAHVVGILRNVQGTIVTPGNASGSETNIYLQGQGWQPFVLAPFPAPGSTNCPNGNGNAGCATGAGANTWAYDWAVPSSSGVSPVNPIVQLADTTFNASHMYLPSLTGETNDQLISLNDGSGGYFWAGVDSGQARIFHGHIGPSCGGINCFTTDVTTSASGWIATGAPANYGSFSRKPSNAPGTNKALWYSLDQTNRFHPLLKSYVLTYAAGAVTAAAPTTVYDIGTCPGFEHTTLGSAFGVNGQFSVDNFDDKIFFGIGSGNQGTVGQHMEFVVSLTSGTCQAIDYEGFTGNGLYQAQQTSGHAGTGYGVGNVITITSGCTVNPTATVATVSSGAVTSLTVTTAGSGCHLSGANTTTGGAGTGLQVDITGTGTPGTFATTWPAIPTASCAVGSTLTCESAITSSVKVFGLHSGAMIRNGTFAHSSGWATTGQGCANCTYLYWDLNSNAIIQTVRPGGHPAIGFSHYGNANNPNYEQWVIPTSAQFDTTCIGPNCQTLFVMDSACTTTPGGIQTHSSAPVPLNDDSYPYILTSTVNNTGTVTTNPPAWTCGLSQSLFSVDTSGNTRWFVHHYQNDANFSASENFEGVDNICTVAPDGKFAICAWDANNPTNGTGFSGNTGLGLDNSSHPYVAPFSIMLN